MKCKRIHLKDFLRFVFFYSYMIICAVTLSHLIAGIYDLILLWNQALHGNTTKGTVFPYTGSINKHSNKWYTK